MSDRSNASAVRSGGGPGAAAASGLYPVLKPPGMTSHDVTAFVRRLTGVSRCGHTGTLDPAAAGVLLVLVGSAAVRLAEYLVGLPKTYVAEIRFGQTTDTQDATGNVIGEASAEAAAGLARADVEAALGRFQGPILQVPPMASAVKVGGRRLHRLARAGKTVERKARPVFVHSIELLEFSPPLARIRVACSSGTYVRTLAHDLGLALGVGAHLRFLVREAVGPFRLENTVSLEELTEAAAAGRLAALAVPAAEAVGHLPGLTVPAAVADCIRQGRAVAWPGGDAGTGDGGSPRAIRVLSETGELVAVATLAAGRLQPRKVLQPWTGGGRGPARR